MRREIAAVVFFLKRLVKKAEKLEAEKVELFIEKLSVALQEKFKGHWYPENPNKGQAYRCIRVNRFHREDPELLWACCESGVRYSDLGLPRELTLWVDPGEICCRFSEKNPCFSVASFPPQNEDEENDAKKVTRALERVTSDYHSGSSSDEESAETSRLTISNRCPSSQKMNPSAPSWYPRKAAPVKVQIVPQPLYNYRPCSTVPHSFWNNLWIPPVYSGGPGYWEPC